MLDQDSGSAAWTAANSWNDLNGVASGGELVPAGGRK
jgi:hypothetical protein